MLTFELRIKHRMATHWEGGYRKADFDRLIVPHLDFYEAKLVWKFQEMSTYEITFNGELDALGFRTELTRRVGLLHRKASYGWHPKI